VQAPFPNIAQGVIEQCHEPEVHVQLLMAVEQCQPWIVGREVDLHVLIATQHDDVLHDTDSGLAGYSCQLEAVSM
jgi:hypothetical protein